jgi:hypothetical protein
VTDSIPWNGAPLNYDFSMFPILRFALVASVFSVQAAVRVTAGRLELRTFFGTDSVRLAFRDGKGLATIDFSDATPIAAGIPGTDGAIAPQFSHNGRWLVYGLGPSTDMTSNATIKSSAWLVPFAGGTPFLAVPDSAHEPRFRRTAGRDALVCPSVGVWNGWKGSGSTWEVPLDLSGAQPKKGASVLLAKGTYYGGANDSFIATGSSRAVMARLAEDPLVPRITLGYTLSWLDGALDTKERQACNTSIYPGPEHPDAMLSLDFGSAGMTNPGINGAKPWGLHDVLFLTRYDGRISTQVTRPERDVFPSLSDTTWTGHHYDDAEWSNHPYFAVANIQVSRAYLSGSGGWINEDMHEILVAIDLRSGKNLVLAQTATVGQGLTSDLQWPNLWIAPNAGTVPQVRNGWLDELSASGIAARPALRLEGRLEKGRFVSMQPLRSLRSTGLDGKEVFWRSTDRDGKTWEAPNHRRGMLLLVGETSLGLKTVTRSLELE